MTYLSCPDTPATTEYATVCIAWELSKAEWKLGVLLPGAQQMSRFTIKGGDLAAVASRLAAARAKAVKSGLPVRLLSCYEAGFEGHWLHRWLEGQGVVSHEVDPSSIEVNRRARRAKTDRIDLARIMRAFLAHLRGEPLACSIVHVPSPQGRGRQAPEPRTRAPAERAHRPHQSPQGAPARTRDPRRQAARARLPEEAQGRAHRRRAGAPAAACGGDRART